MEIKRRLGKRVAPKSRRIIRKIAQDFRDVFSLPAHVKVTQLLEVLQNIGLLEFEIVEDELLGEDEARTYPDKNFIQIKCSVYDKAFSGDPHCRFTIAHEIGHLLMHKGQSSYARGVGGHEVYEDSEWQADTFAGEFLCDVRELSPSDNVYDIQKKFGISYKAAKHRLKTFQKEGMEGSNKN